MLLLGMFLLKFQSYLFFLILKFSKTKQFKFSKFFRTFSFQILKEKKKLWINLQYIVEKIDHNLNIKKYIRLTFEIICYYTVKIEK